MKQTVALLLVLVAIPLFGESPEDRLPDSPGESAKVHRVAGPPVAAYSSRNGIRPVPGADTRDPNKRAFFVLSAAAVASTVADVEFTAHCLKTNPNCREANPLYGSHPSRARMYAISMPVTAAQIWFSNHLRKRHPNRKLWMIPTVSVTVVHSLGAMSTRL